MLVIFDDLIGSSYLKSIANLFTVDVRHMNMQMVFLPRKCLSIANISDQFHGIVITLVFFKNPWNSSEIRILAQKMTPKNLIFVPIYMEATKMPFSYLFINLTQECDPRVKYLSDLFNEFVNVYVVDGSSFTTMKGKNDAGRIPSF